MESSESSDEQLSDLSSPARSSSSEQCPQTAVRGKRKHSEIPLESEEEAEADKSGETSGQTASKSLSGAGEATSSDSGHSASRQGRERVFADGVPLRNTAPRRIPRRRQRRSKSVPPAPSRSQSQRGGASDVRSNDQQGGGFDHRESVDLGDDDNVRNPWGAGAAPVPVWFEEEDDEGEAQRDWAVRTEREYRAYVESRPSIAAELLRQEAVPLEGESECSCQGCPGIGVVRCQECTAGRAVCAECDEKLHPHAHFHHRSIVQEDAFWSPISPTKAIINGQLSNAAKCFSQPPQNPCELCKQSAWGPADVTSEKWAVITLEGRFVFHKAAFKCQTEDCPCIRVQDGAQAVQLGFWIGTVTKVTTLYSMAMLRHWDKTQKHMPGSGLSAFVKILEETGRELGREGPINRHTFGLACSEFKFAKYEFASLGRVRTGLECPACYLDLHSLISDGNRKLYRWDRSYAPFQDCYYGELLIFEDAKVLRTLEALDLQLGVSRPDAQCGTGEWKAARDTRSAIRGQAETGAVFCGCRHQVAMKAVNLVRSGERFGYTYFLDRHFHQGTAAALLLAGHCVQILALAREGSAADGGGREQHHQARIEHYAREAPLMAVPGEAVFGGRYQDGAGAGSGEDMELFFSYMSRLGLVTKNMGPARRGERITEATLHWNEDKRANMAQSLARRLDQSTTRTVAVAQELDRLCQETLEVSASEVSDQKFHEWKAEVQQVAKQQLSRSSRTPSAAVKYFTLVTEVEAARELEGFRQSESFEDSLLCSDPIQQVRSLTAEVVRDLHLKEKKLKELERSLFGQDAGASAPEEMRQRVFEASRTELAEHTITGLQVEIESLLHSLEKFKSRIASEADSAKMHASMRKKESDVKKQVEAAVARYNVVIQKGDQSKRREPANASDLLGGAELPWQFEGREEEVLVVGARMQRTVAFKQKVELVETFNFLQRLREESRLLVGEQRSVLTYYSDMVTDLNKRIESLGSLNDGALGDPVFERESEGQQSRYWVSEDLLRNNRSVRVGCKALLSKARAAAVARLREAKASLLLASEEPSTARSRASDCSESTAEMRLEEEFAEANQGLEGPELARFQGLSERLSSLGLSSLLHRLFRCALSAEQLSELSPDMLRAVNYFSD